MNSSDLKTTLTAVLVRRVRAAEQALIRGTAETADIDAYVAAQLELAARNPLDFVLDARD